MKNIITRTDFGILREAVFKILWEKYDLEKTNEISTLVESFPYIGIYENKIRLCQKNSHIYRHSEVVSIEELLDTAMNEKPIKIGRTEVEFNEDHIQIEDIKVPYETVDKIHERIHAK